MSFYAAHVAEIVALLEAFARSPELSLVKFRIVRNDAFEYVILRFETSGKHSFEIYSIDIGISSPHSSREQLRKRVGRSSVLYGKKSAYVLRYKEYFGENTIENYELVFDTIEAIRAQLEPLKTWLAKHFEGNDQWEP